VFLLGFLNYRERAFKPGINWHSIEVYAGALRPPTSGEILDLKEGLNFNMG